MDMAKIKTRLEDEKLELANKIGMMRTRVLSEKLLLASEKFYCESHLIRVEISRSNGTEFFAVYKIESVDTTGAENLRVHPNTCKGIY